MIGGEVHVVVFGPGVALKAGPFLENQVACLAQVQLVSLLAVGSDLFTAVSHQVGSLLQQAIYYFYQLLHNQRYHYTELSKSVVVVMISRQENFIKGKKWLRLVAKNL